jgi:uncharacterized protein with beta-barrel porin domain
VGPKSWREGLRGRLAWAHDWASNTPLSAAFEALPGAALPGNSALTTASVELRFSPQWSFVAKFDGELASAAQTYAGTGTLRYRWCGSVSARPGSS